jgi:hypothetical protein
LLNFPRGFAVTHVAIGHRPGNRQAWRCVLRSTTSNEGGKELRILVVLEADTIVVTMPGYRYSVAYYKAEGSPGQLGIEGAIRNIQM